MQSGTVQAGQVSLSNFSPFAPAVDLVNIPYWVGPNQKFVNLVTSDAWKSEVNSRVEAKGFTPMFYFCIDPRTISIRSEEHTSELQSLMRISYAVFCLKKKTKKHKLN